MSEKILLVDNATERKECERILGEGFRVLTFPLRKAELPPAANTQFCYLMSAPGDAGELRCLRAMQLLLAAGFPIERIYRIHLPRPINKQSQRTQLEQAFRLPVPVDRILAETYALKQTLSVLIDQKALNFTQIEQLEAEIAEVAAGNLSLEPLQQKILELTRRSNVPGPKPAPMGMACPACNAGRIVERSTAQGVAVFGCTRYPKCRFLAWGKPIEEPCPLCSSPYLILKRLIKGDYLQCPVRGCGYRRATAKLDV